MMKQCTKQQKQEYPQLNKALISSDSLRPSFSKSLGKRPEVFGFHNENYLIYSIKDKNPCMLCGTILTYCFAEVSKAGKIIFQFMVKHMASFDMATKNIVFILSTREHKGNSQGYQICQWSLDEQKNVFVSSEQRFYTLSSTMLIFPQSSLICVCAKGKLKAVSKEKNRKYMISITYYEYPLKPEDNKPIHHFQSDEFSQHLEFQFEKVNSVSLIAIKASRLQKQNNFAKFFTYSIQKGLELKEMRFDSSREFHAEIQQITELKPDLLYLSIKQHVEDTSQSSCCQYLYQSNQASRNATQLPGFIKQNSHIQLAYHFKHSNNKRIYNKMLPRYYVSAQFKVMGREHTEDQMWNIFSSTFDSDMQIWSRYDEETGELAIKLVRLGELQYGEKNNIAFWMDQIQPNFNDDLIYQVLELLNLV